jgi:tetratricopeptide (TPR) repeat protein
MRRALIAAGGCAVLLLAVVQLASMALYGDLAQPLSAPALIPPALGIALARPLGSPAAPAVLRSAYARALLHRGDAAGAAAIVAGLPDAPGTDDLRGRLAELHGDPAAALPFYVRARDFERAQRLIDADEAAAGPARAAALEARLVAILGAAADAGVRARALWRWGQLTQGIAYADPADRGAAHRAMALYERALELAPNEETYLLAAGRQALTIGDKAAARGYYERALEAVPNSADARAGLEQARR